MKDNTMSAQDYIARFGRIIIEDGVDLPDDTPGVDMSDYPQNGEVGNYVDVRSGDQTKLTVTKTKEGDVTVFTVTPIIDGLSSSIRIIPVTTLPVNPEEGVIYLKTKTNVSEDDADQSNYKEEYVWYKTSQNDTGHWEKIGDTSIDLENYVTFDDLEDSEPNGGGSGTSKSVVIPRGKLRLYVNDTSNANFLGEFNPAISSSIVIPIPESTSDLNNDAGFITANQVPRQIQADWDQNDSTAVDYIKNKPEVQPVPSNVSAFNNDAGYLTEHQSLAGYATTSQIPEVGNGVLTIRVNGTETTFGANQSNNVAVDINTGSSVQQVQSDWEEQDNSSPAYIRNKPTPTEPIEYRGEGGVTVNNTTHVISLEDGIITQPADPETPSNYYTFNGTKVVVPQGRGIIRLNHDYRLPSGSSPAFYDAGLYIEDPSVIPPATARELEYMTVMLQYPEGVPAECPLFATVASHGNSVAPHGEYARPQQFNIPINAKGSIVQDNNINDGYPVYDEIFRNGDYCYDNLGNLYTLDNIACRFSGYTGRSGGDVSFAIVPKLQAYDTEQSTYFVRRQFQSWDYTSTEPVANEYDYCVLGSEINSQHLGYVPNNQQNYGRSYQFVSAYKNPTTDKVFYLYGTPNDTVALCCYLREMDNGNIRPAFAGFLLFGTPWSLEQPIERNQMPIEVTAFQWAESDQEIRIVDASTINGSLTNIDTTAYKANNIVVLTNTAENTTYAYVNSRNQTKHISGNPDYDIIFRYCGNSKFQPIAFPIPID